MVIPPGIASASLIETSISFDALSRFLGGPYQHTSNNKELFILLLLSLRPGGEGSLPHRAELCDVPIVGGRMGRAYGAGGAVGYSL